MGDADAGRYRDHAHVGRGQPPREVVERAAHRIAEARVVDDPRELLGDERGEVVEVAEYRLRQRQS